MIFYFSGTGNSQWAAKRISEITGDALVSIPLMGNKKNTYHSVQPIVFVAPTYAWRMPKAVEQWIQKTQFEGNQDAYFVLTCGGSCGNAAAYAKKLCKKKGMRFCGLAKVVMPENYVAMFPTPGKEECQAIMQKAEPCVAELAGRIKDKKPFRELPVSLAGRFQSGPVNLIFYPLFVKDKGFHVSDKCIACGKCVKRCPLINIDMVNGRPVWKGNCTHCMACIGGCPVEAIEYQSKSKGKNRYYIREEERKAETERGL